jgi:hypothetical protein
MAGSSVFPSERLNVFIRALFGELQRRAHELSGLRSSQCGAVTFVQRYRHLPDNAAIPGRMTMRSSMSGSDRSVRDRVQRRPARTYALTPSNFSRRDFDQLVGAGLTDHRGDFVIAWFATVPLDELFRPPGNLALKSAVRPACGHSQVDISCIYRTAHPTAPHLK